MRHAHATFSATDDYAKVVRLAESVREEGSTARGTQAVEDAIRQIKELGVSFDGKMYWYQGYGYDQVADAVKYALLDRARSKREATSGAATEWLETARPTPAEQRLMKEQGITFDGRCYSYAGYRYDSLADALNYAQLKH